VSDLGKVFDLPHKQLLLSQVPTKKKNHNSSLSLSRKKTRFSSHHTTLKNMRRIIGGKRSSNQSQSTLQDTTSTLDKRGDVLGSKIDKIDVELRKLKKQMSEAKTAQMKERWV